MKHNQYFKVAILMVFKIPQNGKILGFMNNYPGSLDEKISKMTFYECDRALTVNARWKCHT